MECLLSSAPLCSRSIDMCHQYVIINILTEFSSSLTERQRDVSVISSQGESCGDLEMFYIVEFLSVLVNVGPSGSISAMCQFFYLVAFF